MIGAQFFPTSGKAYLDTWLDYNPTQLLFYGQSCQCLFLCLHLSKALGKCLNMVEHGLEVSSWPQIMTSIFSTFRVFLEQRSHDTRHDT